MKFLLVIFLSAIFLGGAAAQDLPVDAPPGKGYKIGPGDVIAGKVLGEEQYNFTAAVDEDGKIEVPFSDTPIMAKCKTERELRSEITTLLSTLLRKPQLSLQVGDKSLAPATIYGEVNSPQQILLKRKATLVEVLAFAGGVKEEAGGLIQVFRTQPPRCTAADDEGNWKANTNDPTDVPSRTFSLAEVKQGKDDANPIIYPGDVVVVQKAAPVYITGEVVSPQGIYIKEEGLSLTEALAKIGGVGREAKKNDIKIYRLKANSKERDVISANYDQIKKGAQKDVLLQPYDIIEVGKRKESILTSIMKVAIGAGQTLITSTASTGGLKVIY